MSGFTSNVFTVFDLQYCYEWYVMICLMDNHGLLCHSPYMRSTLAKASRLKMKQTWCRVIWDRAYGCYRWPELQILKNEKGFGLYSINIKNSFALPYLGKCYPHITESRYIMEIPRRVQSSGKRRCRYIDANPDEYGVYIQDAKVGMFGLAIAGFINEPSMGEEVNIAFVDQICYKNVPVYMKIPSPINSKKYLYIPIFISILACCEIEHGVELLTAYYNDRCKGVFDATFNYKTGLSKRSLELLQCADYS